MDLPSQSWPAPESLRAADAAEPAPRARAVTMTSLAESPCRSRSLWTALRAEWLGRCRRPRPNGKAPT